MFINYSVQISNFIPHYIFYNFNPRLHNRLSCVSMNFIYLFRIFIFLFLQVDSLGTKCIKIQLKSDLVLKLKNNKMISWTKIKFSLLFVITCKVMFFKFAYLLMIHKNIFKKCTCLLLYVFMMYFNYFFLVSIAQMDPGRDSIIYRMTSNRMKKEN